MYPWLTQMLYDVNERFLPAAELDRFKAFHGSLPARLRTADEIERTEGDVERELLARLCRQFPDRKCYSPRLVRDVIEALRVAVQAMLADDPRLFRVRVTDHLVALALSLDAPGDLLARPFAVLHEILSERLDVQQLALIEPYVTQVTEALAESPAA